MEEEAKEDFWKMKAYGAATVNAEGKELIKTNQPNKKC